MQKDILFIGAEERLPLYQDAYEEMNEQLSFRVVTDLHGTLQAIKDHLPNLILVDHEVLGKRSIEICQTLKKYPGTQRLPLIFIVPRAQFEDLLEVLYIPVDDYVFLDRKSAV